TSIEESTVRATAVRSATILETSDMGNLLLGGWVWGSDGCAMGTLDLRQGSPPGGDFILKEVFGSARVEVCG
ncbi:MAG TPA: hypothetical protein VE093_23380, partial [Polyangiaceae bacterium]|nr:hypothetical protein [Polyangiaceae bacterium]